MLRRFMKDDIKAAFGCFFPLAATLFLLGGTSAFCSGKLGGSGDSAAMLAVSVFDFIYESCQRLLLISALPAVLLRIRGTLTGSGALFWQSIPAKPWKHIVSKSVCTVVLYLISAVLYGVVKLIYLRTGANGAYAASAYYTISADPAQFLRDTAFSGALILLVMLCVQKLITGALLFTRREHGRAVVWLLALAGIITTSGMYIAGYAAISRLSLFSISGSSARLLTYSYSCAFFGVMSVVFTVTDTLLLSKRAEF